MEGHMKKDCMREKKEHIPLNEDELCELAELFKGFGDSTRVKIL